MAQVIINNTDRDSARDLLDCAGVRWSEAINSTNARHYQAALDRIAQLMAGSRELAEALREVTDRYERLDRRHALPDSGPNGSIARARAALTSLATA